MPEEKPPVDDALAAEIEKRATEIANRRRDTARKREERARKKLTTVKGEVPTPAVWTCESCKGTVEYGENQCPSCGNLIDWRHSPLSYSKFWVVCPNCGCCWKLEEYGDAECPFCGVQAVQFE